MQAMLKGVQADRVVKDTFDLVTIPSPTGNTMNIAKTYQEKLSEAGFQVERYDFIPDNPTLVATFGDESIGKTLLFSGHMDVIPVENEAPAIRDGIIYGRGTCDMKGSLACILEALRVIKETGSQLKGRIMVVANSLHESPGGRGEDLYIMAEKLREEKIDAAVVMEGATYDCTIAQFGSATFLITISREGEPSHQLYTSPGTPHPISIASEVVSELDRLNAVLEKQWIEDIGYESYFVGRVTSGQFFNQLPSKAVLEGVRRYGPTKMFEQIEQEFRELLDGIAKKHDVEIELDLQKVRDGYKVAKDSPIVTSLVNAVRTVRQIDCPLVGRKLVTDAGIFANNVGIPTVCYGPDARSAHSEAEFVTIDELELTTKVYLQLIDNYVGLE
jgi:acetylornithine deacetylase/succinyl-diaminopimelate desuccinylase-like protein